MATRAVVPADIEQTATCGSGNALRRVHGQESSADCSSMPGVASARVNLTARTVSVAHDKSVGDRDLVAALEAIGFEVEAAARSFRAARFRGPAAARPRWRWRPSRR